jgi:septal ring factor EnvC (AmiA/AmiB activator)
VRTFFPVIASKKAILDLRGMFKVRENRIWNQLLVTQKYNRVLCLQELSSLQKEVEELTVQLRRQKQQSQQTTQELEQLRKVHNTPHTYTHTWQGHLNKEVVKLLLITFTGSCVS